MTTERRNVTNPSDWWVAFAQQAAKDGQTLSEWAGECMKANLPADVAKKLTERPAAHRPKGEK